MRDSKLQKRASLKEYLLKLKEFLQNTELKNDKNEEIQITNKILKLMGNLLEINDVSIKITKMFNKYQFYNDKKNELLKDKILRSDIMHHFAELYQHLLFIEEFLESYPILENEILSILEKNKTLLSKTESTILKYILNKENLEKYLQFIKQKLIEKKEKIKTAEYPFNKLIFIIDSCDVYNFFKLKNFHPEKQHSYLSFNTNDFFHYLTQVD